MAKRNNESKGRSPGQGSPQDYEDVLGPERSGGMEQVVTSGLRPAGLRKDEGWGAGTAGVQGASQAERNGNGNGLSGGAARPVPTAVGTLG